MPDARPTVSGLGRFEILDPIGAGGMGSVYRAYDPKLDRQLAIKVVGGNADLEPGSTLNLGAISPELAPRTRVLDHRLPTHNDERGDRRLLEEARAMAQLSHPNVVSVYEVGSDGDRLFIAMELVEGRNMREWLAEESPSPREILAVFRQAAAGLAAAHAAGLVHRDFKPDNVLIGEDGHIQVADFGLALSATNDASSESVTIAGTPAYMAPELEGGAAPSSSSDVFAFCASLVEALRGEPPEAGDSIASGRGISRSVARGISRGLSVDPSARPEDGATLGRLLAPANRTRAALAGGGMLAAGLAATLAIAATHDNDAACDTSPRLLAAWNEESKETISERLRSLGGALATDTTIRVSSILDRRAKRLSVIYRENCEAIERGETEKAVGRARSECLDIELTALESAVDYLATLDRAGLERAVAVARSEARPEACLLIDAQASDLASEETAAIWRALEDVRTVAGSQSSVLSEKREELETLFARAQATEDERLIGEILDTLARSEQASKRYDKAIERLRELIKISPDERLVAAATLRLADIVGAYQENPSEAETLLALAESAIGRLPNDSRLEYHYVRIKLKLAFARADLEASEALSTRLFTIIENDTAPGVQARRFDFAVAHSILQGRTADALKYEKARTAARLEELGPHHPSYASALTSLATSLELYYRPEEAITHFDKALAIYAELGDEENTFKVESKRANAIHSMDRPADAIPLYAALLERARAGSPERKKLVGYFHYKIGSAHYSLGELEKADQRFADAQSAFTKAFGDSHRKMLNPVLARANVALARKDFDTAKAGFLEYRDRTETAYGGQELWRAISDKWLAFYHLERGEPTRALALYQKANAVLDEVKMMPSRMKAQQRTQLARCLNDLGRFDEAAAILDEVIRVTGQGTGSDSMARFELARARYELGGGEQALRDARSAEDSIKKRPTPARYQLPRIAAWINSKENVR